MIEDEGWPDNWIHIAGRPHVDETGTVRNLVCGIDNGETTPACYMADVAMANARLIAAAPDMLEALTDALNMIEEWDETRRPDSYKEWDFVVKMRAAINKAGGSV